jgi:hypothetical protein
MRAKNEVNSSSNISEDFYRQKYGTFWFHNVRLTKEEMQLPEIDLADTIAAVQGRTFQPKEPKPACEVVTEMLAEKPQTTNQSTSGGLGIGVGEKGGVIPIVTPTNTITSYDKDSDTLLRADIACRCRLFQGMHPAQFMTREAVLRQQKQAWAEDVIKTENSERKFR